MNAICTPNRTALINAACHQPEPKTFAEIHLLRRVVGAICNPLPVVIKRCYSPHTTTAKPRPAEPEPMILVEGWPVRDRVKVDPL